MERQSNREVHRKNRARERGAETKGKSTQSE
jgi:hypothetical protein